MAYKFMIGEARLSGSIVAEEGLTADLGSNIIASGSDSEIRLTADDGSTNLFQVDVQTIGSDEFGRVTIKSDIAGADNIILIDSDELSSSVDIHCGGDIQLTPNASIGIDIDSDLITLNNEEVAVRGTLKADSVAANNATNGLDIDGTGVNTGTFNILLTDALASALDIKEGSNSYLKFVTTNGSEAVVFGKDVQVSALSASGQITAGNFDADGAGAFGSVTTDTTIVAGTTVSGAGQIQGASFDADGAGAFGNVVADTTVVAGTNVSGAGELQGAAVSASLNITAGGIVNGNSLVTAGNIGVAGDHDLIQLTANSASVNGQLTVDGNLIVLGDTFSASVGTLVIEDALISIGDGQGTYADGYGIEFGSPGSAWAELKTAQVNSSNHLSSSLPIAAPSFYGDGSNITGVTATAGGYALRAITQNQGTTFQMSGQTGIYGFQNDHSAAFNIDLSGGAGGANWSQGDLVIIKSNASGSDFPLTIRASGSNVIDGEDQIVLESAFAAVTLVYDGFAAWQII